MTDTLNRHAPLRASWRAQHRAQRSLSSLLPWDLFLTALPAGDAGALAQAVIAERYLNVSARYALTPTRQEAFEVMALAGLDTVPWCAHVRDTPGGWETLVVYTSDYGGHVGLDKVRLGRAEALAAHPDALCSRWMPPLVPRENTGASGVSVRVLKVGQALLSMRMTSGDWRSNVGAVTQVWLDGVWRVNLGEAEALLGPLWAVDFVPQPGGRLLACDFNTSPGMTGGPAEHLRGGAMLDEIEAWFAQGPQGPAWALADAVGELHARWQAAPGG